MKSYKNILIFALAWFGLFFLTEFFMDQIFSDQTPVWKLLAVSLISALALVYPFIKKGKDFTIDQVRKKQQRCIALKQGLAKEEILRKIEEVLKVSGFIIKTTIGTEITFRTKMSLSTFGENYKLLITAHEILIDSLPAIYTLPFDGGAVYNEINSIQKKIEDLKL